MDRFNPRLYLIAFQTCLAVFVGVDGGESAEPELKGVFPATCRIGDSVDVTLEGSGLDQGGSVHFSQPGLHAEHLEKDRFRVTASASVKPGDLDLWVATSEGLAGPRRFSITSHPHCAEQESNDTRETAQELSIPTVVDARLDKAADLDWFAFHGEKDQQVSIKCRSISLDSSVQPSFTILDSTGREWLHSSPSELEPLSMIELPAQGTFYLLVHDRAYRKSDGNYYQIELTRNDERELTDSQDRVVCVEDLFSDLPVHEEQIQSRSAPQRIEVPCRIQGQFVERNEVDWFQLNAEKGQVLHIEAFGERLGQQMDLEIAIYDSKKKRVAIASDTAAPKGIPASIPLGSLDPSTAWKAPGDGLYCIALRDLYGGSVYGEGRVYELIVGSQRPDYYVVAMSGGNKLGRGIFIKPGGVTEISLTVVRSGGFSGEVSVSAEGENVGLRIDPCVLAAKEITKTMKVSAAKDAPPGFQTLRLVAEAEIESDKRIRPVHHAATIRDGRTRRVNNIVMYVNP